jgi:type II secretory pathway pseudopilin PulG
MVKPRSRGFTYLALLFIVAILSGGLALTGVVWHTVAQREKEAELLFVGHQYRQAIARYYLAGPRQYPRTLADLLKDPRRPGAERYLRRLYPDPLTGSGEWGLVRGPDGGIQGVYSLSKERPLKSAGFRAQDRELAGASSYTDWKFLHTPQGTAPPAGRM